LFGKLKKQEKTIIIDAMENKNFEAHQTVIKQNDAGDVLFVVEEGELDCYKLMVRTFFTNYTISA
jgi:cAMP-dependent protein kinase regulator